MSCWIWAVACLGVASTREALVLTEGAEINNNMSIIMNYDIYSEGKILFSVRENRRRALLALAVQKAQSGPFASVTEGRCHGSWPREVFADRHTWSSVDKALRR